ncbi:MAG: SPFH domain-containing protein [Firmicutes bacterium]|nr:SPFH domain-containing protein [Bacillota bacterium]
MGLIKALTGSVGGVLADQWREYFYCEAISTDVLVTKGQRRIDKRSSNKKGVDNIITNGSVMAVANGQAMAICDQGKVVEFCAEPGEFVWDSSSEPTIFYGGLGKGIVNSFKNIGKRFTFGGQPGKDQRIYYFNIKEITSNKYGTPQPVPFRVVDTNIGLDVDISIRCNGEYSYKMTDPILFFTNVSGNVADEYRRDKIDGQLKSELLTALQPAFAQISAKGIRYSALPGHTMEISDALNEVLGKKWGELRGIEVAAFGINTVSASKEDEDMIKELQRTAVMRNPGMAGAVMVGAQADAMKTAAGNAGGAFMGFMGMNAAMGSGGMNANQLFTMDQQQQRRQLEQQQAEQQAAAGGWKCGCGAVNKGKFCHDCGKPQPVDETWKCECGAINKGKFCAECGKPRSDKWKCECGAENTGRFCAECGKSRN